jgi:transketolase
MSGGKTHGAPDFRAKARELRQELFRTICNSGGGHLPTCLSMLDILTVLYYSVLNVDPKNPKHPDRDRFILSKGHAGVALYAVLADRGFFDREHLQTHGKKGTILGGHPDMHKIPGVEASTGALGHGLPFAAGIALAGKKDRKSYRVFVVLGDGECQEGSIWETALFAPQYHLDNLTVVIDYNKLQAMDRIENIIGLEPLRAKWEAFGWSTAEVDGHDPDALHELFLRVPFEPGKPSLIVANTIKGKGIKFMENVPIWHFRQPQPHEVRDACTDLGLDLVDGVIR